MPAVLLMQADSKGLSWATISMREMAQGRPPLDGSVRERVSLFKIKTWHRLPQDVQRSRVAAKRTFVNFGSRPEAVLEQHTKPQPPEADFRVQPTSRNVVAERNTDYCAPDLAIG